MHFETCMAVAYMNPRCIFAGLFAKQHRQVWKSPSHRRQCPAPWSPEGHLLPLVTRSSRWMTVSNCISDRRHPGQEMTYKHTPKHLEGNLPAILSGSREPGRSHSSLSLLLFPLMLISSFLSTWVGHLWVTSPFDQQGAFIDIHGVHACSWISTADVQKFEIGGCHIAEIVFSLSFSPSVVL